jgi:DMSO/TMAO reductase YedYZ molybdopterin-dependent catalytic subunit
MNTKKNLLIVAVVTSTILIGSLLWIRYNDYKDSPLKSIETREYQGQDLSSITDFRENSLKGPQFLEEEEYLLTVTSYDNRNLTYSYEDILSTHTSHQKIVTLHCIEGWSVTILWEGVLVKDVIEEIGVDPDTKIIIFRAIDGYSTSLPLDYILENDIIIAYKMNDVTLPPERGFPFQLVAESKWGYKWIKWITQIELSNDDSFRGFYESRGFSNDANVDQ